MFSIDWRQHNIKCYKKYIKITIKSLSFIACWVLPHLLYIYYLYQLPKHGNLLLWKLMKIKFYLSFCLFLLVCISVSRGQNISISLGPDQIALNEAFTITITVKNERLTGYEGFPEIPGFLKRGTSSSSSTNIINGQISSSQSVTQNYIAQKEGSYTLKPFYRSIIVYPCAYQPCLIYE